jgi:tetratricopeptide (TPR) repeat protein
LKHAINLDLENTDAHYSLGLAFGRLKRYQEAKDQYHKVLQLDPKHTGAYERLAFTEKVMKSTTVSSQKDVLHKEQDITLVP